MVPAFIVAKALCARHRAFIALYSLDAGHRNPAEVLRQNNVTEDDLHRYFDSWFEMRCRIGGPVA
ncbi:hypothetical protein [Hymenobacter rubripertinctus]|uniref:Uncharacterized protein n=1 Tax=Hymenobacter rubripertinctus TaxID=2029981 RepID=A0A418QLK1_9BACT|nr:hypothetical protein [Hymenobacter rubripertinctus]RIY06031.1 hypothetical protein D0T11_19505 [Hymenobacter rubripertinctus]